MRPLVRLLLPLAAALLDGRGASANSKSRGVDRAIKILNESKSRFLVYWVHPDTREAVLMSDGEGIVNGAEFPLNSYVGHEFEIREMPDKKTGECNKSEDQTCRRTFFAVSENDEQVARVNEDFVVEFVDNKIKAQLEAGDLVEKCQQDAKRKIAAAEGGSDASKIVDELMNCVESGVAGALERVNEEIAFQAEVRKDIAAKLENYTCVDDTLNSTKDIETTAWRNPKEPGVTRTVHIKHNRAASKIHVIENFIRPDECEAMEEAARPTLHHATVADGKGGSQLSDNRKAMQAGITVPWDKEKDDDPIARISRRVYDYTNHVLGLGISEAGQEDLMSIQYFGRGKDDKEPDQYTPHCDGDCTGLQHKPGTRMATMVMYCDTAESGGHTNFRNAGVHVKPEPLAAIFFSYIDPETRVMDTGFTEHSGCPVYEGSKKIVTQWIRLGVDEENPWNSFNTLGIKKSEVVE